MALSLPIEDVRVSGPFQLAVQMNHVNVHPLDVNGLKGRTGSVEVHHHLLHLGGVLKETIVAAPLTKSTCQVPVFLLLSTPNTQHNSCVIRVLLYVTGLSCC